MKRSKKEKNTQLSLSTSMPDLMVKLMNEDNVDEFNKIKSLFDLNMKKKELLRVSKLSDLQDKTVDEMSVRLTKKSGEFNNQDLINYFKTIQESISKTDTTFDNIDLSTIKVIQNQLNINVKAEDTLSRESKEKVIQAIRSILSKSESKDVINDVDYKEVEDSNNV